MTLPMGTFRTDVELEHAGRFGPRMIVRGALVDTGAALSWFPGSVLSKLRVRPLKEWHFRQANGTLLTRWSAEVRVFAPQAHEVKSVALRRLSHLQ